MGPGLHVGHRTPPVLLQSHLSSLRCGRPARPAGVFCAVVSQPADNLVSKLNANKAATVGSVVSEMGMVGLFTRGLPLRIVMVRPSRVGHLRGRLTPASLRVNAKRTTELLGPDHPSRLPSRQVGTLTGLQWGIYDAFKVFVGLCAARNAPEPPSRVLRSVKPAREAADSDASSPGCCPFRPTARPPARRSKRVWQNCKRRYEERSGGGAAAYRRRLQQRRSSAGCIISDSSSVARCCWRKEIFIVQQSRLTALPRAVLYSAFQLDEEYDNESGRLARRRGAVASARRWRRRLSHCPRQPTKESVISRNDIR